MHTYGPFQPQPGPRVVVLHTHISHMEAVQRRATNIIFGYSSPTPYFAILALAGIPSLQARRLDFSKRFFRKICQPTSCLHHLLPPPRDPAVTSRLRKSTLYPRPILRSKRYCSTINYALLNFQQSCVSCVLFYIFTVLLFHWQCCLLILYILFCCLH